MQLQSFKVDTVIPQAVTSSETEIPFFRRKKKYFCVISAQM